MEETEAGEFGSGPEAAGVDGAKLYWWEGGEAEQGGDAANSSLAEETLRQLLKPRPERGRGEKKKV